MKYFLEKLADSSMQATSQLPVWNSGIWDCGNYRQQDQSGSLYKAIQLDDSNAANATDSGMISALQAQAAVAAKKGDNFTATKLLLQAAKLGG